MTTGQLPRDAVTLGKRLFDMLDFFLSQKDHWIPQEKILTMFYGDTSEKNVKKFYKDRERLATILDTDDPFEHDGKNPRSWRCVRGCDFDVAKIEDKKELLTLAAGLEMAKKFIPEYREIADMVQSYFYGAINNIQQIQAQKILHGIDWNVPVAEKTQKELALPHCYTLVLDALQEKTPIQIHYDSPEHGVLKTTVVPWELYFQYHDWYFRGADIENGMARVFRITRVQKIERVHPEHLRYTSMPLHVARSFERGGNNIPLDPATAGRETKTFSVRLKIFGRFADAVHRVCWFPHEKKTWISETPEVEKVLLYEVELESLWWISKWILRGADSVQVLGPQELKNIVRKDAEKFLLRNSVEITE
jgi:predicted DNA-binding transcriptional regulator YafY